MTYQEAADNLRRPVTITHRDGNLYNGKIYDLNPEEEWVQINFGEGNLGPFCWAYPSMFSFGWNGHPYTGPGWDVDKDGKEVLVYSLDNSNQ